MCLGLPPRDYCCLSVLVCGAGGLTPGLSRAPLCASAFGAAQWEGDCTPVFPSHLMKGATRCPGLAYNPAPLRAPQAGLWPWLERIPSFRRLGSAVAVPPPTPPRVLSPVQDCGNSGSERLLESTVPGGLPRARLSAPGAGSPGPALLTTGPHPRPHHVPISCPVGKLRPWGKHLLLVGFGRTLRPPRIWPEH